MHPRVVRRVHVAVILVLHLLEVHELRWHDGRARVRELRWFVEVDGCMSTKILVPDELVECLVVQQLKRAALLSVVVRILFCSIVLLRLPFTYEVLQLRRVRFKGEPDV